MLGATLEMGAWLNSGFREDRAFLFSSELKHFPVPKNTRGELNTTGREVCVCVCSFKNAVVTKGGGEKHFFKLLRHAASWNDSGHKNYSL